MNNAGDEAQVIPVSLASATGNRRAPSTLKAREAIACRSRSGDNQWRCGVRFEDIAASRQAFLPDGVWITSGLAQQESAAVGIVGAAACRGSPGLFQFVA